MGSGDVPERWIVAGTDGSERSLEAVEWAAAEAVERGMSLRVCHVLPARSRDVVAGGPPDRGRGEYARAILSDAAERARRIAPGVPVTVESLAGHPVRALVDASSGTEALVLGSRGGGGFAALLLGGVSEQAAMHGECPVLVVRGRRRAGPMVVGADGSPGSRAALAFAFARAGELGVPVRAVHAYTTSVAVPSYSLAPDDVVTQLTESARQTLDDALAPWTERYPDVTVIRRLVDDIPSVALVDESEGSGLLVVGSRGHGGFAGMLLGSVSRHALRHATCPVAVVRP